jgi:V/A-type H+-transporting ATPase subunit D
VPEYSINQKGDYFNYGMSTSTGSLDVALDLFSKIVPKLIMLAAEEKGLQLMAAEIERTRRRVNALEHVLVPSFVETIRYITMKLDEQERASLGRLMRVKEIVRSH